MSAPSHRFGPFELRPAARELRRDGALLALGARAFDVLIALVERGGALVTKDQLLDAAWPGLVVEEANVQVQISALRKALGARAIATVPGLGYRFAFERDDEKAAPAPPPPAAGPLRQGAWPRWLDAAIERDDELCALDAIAQTCRVITIVGPGGIGKTRLAAIWAEAHAQARSCPAAWIDLAPIDDGQRLVPAVAAALAIDLGASTEGIDAARDTLLRALGRGGARLLVFDNAERVLAALAPLVAALVDAQPALGVLVTSQEPLHLPGEQVLRLAPLQAPRAGMDGAAMRGCAAMRLLALRARAVDRHFAFDEANTAAAAELCRRLGGHALAIEIAAARLPLLGASTLLARLDEQLRWPHAAPRSTSPERQRSLRATLAWSHGLLGEPARTLLRRLAVFADSFDLDAAIAQAAAGAPGPPGPADEAQVVDALCELVDKSLVRIDRTEPLRYRLAEATRLFAAEQLAEAGECDAAEQQHQRLMAARAERALAAFWREREEDWLAASAGDDHDWQRAAARACRVGDAQAAAPLLAALIRLDQQRGIGATRRARMRAAADLVPRASGCARARLALAAAPHAQIVVGTGERLGAAADAVAAWREVGEAGGLHEALLVLAYEQGLARHFDAAEATLAEARSLLEREPGARRRQVHAGAAGCIAGWRGDGAAYRRHARDALDAALAAGDVRAALRARLRLVDAALTIGDAAEAVAIGEEVVPALEAVGAPELLANAWLNLCAAQLRLGRLDAARANALRALPLARAHEAAGFLFDHVAELAARSGHAGDAARLIGASRAWYARQGFQREANEAASLDAAAAIAERALGVQAAAREQSLGAGLADDEVDALVRAACGGA